MYACLAVSVAALIWRMPLSQPYCINVHAWFRRLICVAFANLKSEIDTDYVLPPVNARREAERERVCRTTRRQRSSWRH